MSYFHYLLSAVLLAQVGSGEGRYSTEGGNPVIEGVVKVQEEVRIPAQEAGVLINMPVKEGSRVAKGDLLATVDDREAEAALKIAEYGLQAANKRAEDVIEETYARKAAEVAKVDWRQSLEAVKQKKDAISDIEIRQKQLVFERSFLQIEKARKDRVLAELDANTKEAERDAAKEALDRRNIYAPFDGEVVEMFLHEAEWVNPGDPILMFSRFDVLYVEGRVYASEYDRSELMGKPVTVRITKAREREVSVPGTVVHVSQNVVGRLGSYTVRVEIQNQRDGDHWVIQPGLSARMTIHLDGTAQAAKPSRRK